MRSFVITGVALSVDMVFCVPLLSIVRLWLFTSMKVDGTRVLTSSLLYLDKIFLSFAIKHRAGDPHELAGKL